MIGAIVGDIIGSVHEFGCGKRLDFPLFDPGCTFTDDTVLTVAVADCLLTGASYVDRFHEYTKTWPDCSYGGRFHHWIATGSREPYGSWGNGSAMRVSPIAWAFEDADAVLAEARRSAAVTHDHPEGVKGAQASALAVWMARTGASKEDIRTAIASRFGYDLARTCDTIRPGYSFDESCQGTVPEAIIAFLDANDYEHAIRLAISLGGDADTLACITGGIAAAYYGGVPREIQDRALGLLAAPLREVVDRFCARYAVAGT